jgi:hypothetical protein
MISMVTKYVHYCDRLRWSWVYICILCTNLLHSQHIYVYADPSSSTSFGILRRTFRETPSSCNTVSCTIRYPYFLGIQSKKINQYIMPIKPINNAKMTCDCMPTVSRALLARKDVPNMGGVHRRQILETVVSWVLWQGTHWTRKRRQWRTSRLGTEGANRRTWTQACTKGGVHPISAGWTL